jgi:hypothetical protein
MHENYSILVQAASRLYETDIQRIYMHVPELVNNVDIVHGLKKEKSI